MLFFVILIGYSQKEFHVFPKTHSISPGKTTGNGSLNQPWDLQTALSQSSETVNGGDIIWLHEGVYNGRFYSKLSSIINGKYITVSSFPNEWAILNGNVSGVSEATLTVNGNNVTYRDFEISPTNLIIRDESVEGFLPFGGVSHNSGENCQFINLIIHGNNGLGFGSWKNTGGTIISNCIVYNNGYKGKKYAGIGEGFYVQNNSNTKTRILKNNIIFNNYYKGIEVWSANKKASNEYVKNINLDNNVVFNSGLVSGRTVDNVIVATNDRNGINIAKNIQVTNNIFYHNTTLSEAIENSDAPSLTLGFNNNSPVENINILNNIIIGRKDALRVLSAKSITFKNNTIYSGYARLFKPVMKYINNTSWIFENNTYYTRNSKPIRIQGEIDYSVKQWQDIYGLGINSKWKHFKEFTSNQKPIITKINTQENTYRVVLFNKEMNDVLVDFSEYNLPSESSYIIKDVENFKTVLASGKLNESSKVEFKMNVDRDANKSYNNFGVYYIEFKKNEKIETESFFERFLNWLGI
ncbi:hypothetical protein LX78_02116 [Xanthomarina spongicola]|uniref:Parallel beta helix pectate lyase-like protein n=1 Tax=Xanthomarina spongicola TaxID=570520 RepID=A0A316DIX8_9FLAO|nr:hypothetical protein LX78_02116 [Xanthomarina spongicola]